MIGGGSDGGCWSGGGGGGFPDDDGVETAEEFELKDLEGLLILSFFLLTILLPILEHRLRLRLCNEFLLLFPC